MDNKMNGKWLRSAIAAAVLVGLSGQAMAGRYIEVADYFYADDAHTGRPIGYTIYACGSAPTTVVGQSSPYVVQVETDCDGAVPRAQSVNALPTIFHHCSLGYNPYPVYICSG